MIGLKILEGLGLYQPLDHEHKRFERLAQRCNEIERIFWSAGYFELSKWGRLTPQLKVGPYYLDFALQSDNFKLAIEIDGHEAHKTKAQRGADYERENYLKERGWRFVRFTGQQIYKDAQRAVFQTIRILRGLR